jgi:hypothetical protein
MDAPLSSTAVSYAGLALSLELLTTLTAIAVIKPRQAVGVLSGAIGVLQGMDIPASASQAAALREAAQIPSLREQLGLSTQ